MDRLTERFENGQVGVAGCGKNCKYSYKYCENAEERCPVFNEIYEKLAAYEDAEEQGLLLRLPCKVGDTVYVPTRNFISELRVTEVTYDRDGTYLRWVLLSGIYPNLNGFVGRKIGNEVFLTKSEAEAKLKEMEGNHE